MSPTHRQKDLLFVSDIGGPMIFTFVNILNIQKNKLIDRIQSNGGEVVEYDDRSKFTIVLTKKDKYTDGEIQFNLKYVTDCLKKNQILPLESYRLGKKVTDGCYYSKPLGSSQCIFSNLIQKGRCKHKIRDGQNDTQVDSSSDNDAALKKQIKAMKSLIFPERKREFKKEPEFWEESMEVVQEEQPFSSESLIDKYAQSLSSYRTKFKANRRAPLKRVKKKPRTKAKSRAFRGGSRRRLRARH